MVGCPPHTGRSNVERIRAIRMNALSEPHPLRIFVVENHPDTLKYLTIYLEQMGHTVHSARSMHEALEHLPSAESQVLISDIGLPDGDGWELLQRSRLAGSVYAIAMSGFGMNAD